MTFQPVLPPLLLVALAAAVVAARVVTLRRTARTRAARWRWAGLTVAALLLVAAAARPTLTPVQRAATQTADGSAPNVFLVVDRSPDMGVVEPGADGSRMDLARADASALIERYPHARFGVISFAARPSLDWPLSADAWSLEPVLAALAPYDSPPDAVTQTSAGVAGNVLRYQLFGAVQQYPRAKNLVFYLGAGAPESEQPPTEFDLPEGVVDGGAVLGYGPATPVLRGVAEQLGVPYVSRGGRAPLAAALPPAELPAAGPAVASKGAEPTELYWALALGAAALLLLESYLLFRELRRTRLATADVGS